MTAESARFTDNRPTVAKNPYDEFQQAAIEAPTPALIVAGPGSGKTSTLIGRTEYLIHTLKVQPEHILALTFSRKAAQEMKERLEVVLDDDIALPTVSTFHAFCAELLRTYGHLVGLRPDFTLIDDAEGYILLRQLTQDMRLQHYRNVKSPAYYFPDILKAISRTKDELVSPAQYQRLAERMLEQAQDDEAKQQSEKALEVAGIYHLYQDGLRRRQDTDFGGLLLLTVQLLEQYPEVRQAQQQHYQHILVDEFQDINRASGVLLRLLAGDERRVWVVGDANQAIYAFRGASPANIAKFQEEYLGAVVLPLSRNYRSRPDIVHLAESFRYKQLELGAEAAPETNQPARLTHSDTYVTLAVATDAASELNGLIADIRDKHAQGYTYQDMVILCRTRSLARKITRALALAGLPVLESGGMLEQEQIKDVLSIVLLLAERSGMGILRAARQNSHALSQSDVEALLLSAWEQQRPPGMLIADGDAPPAMSTQGRRVLMRLSNILQSLSTHATSVWSLLAQYLFIETSLVRDLLCVVDRKRDGTRRGGGGEDAGRGPLWPPAGGEFLGGEEEKGSERALSGGELATRCLTDYRALLQLAQRYDQQQQTLRIHQVQEAGEQQENALPLPTIQEQARGFLDYLNILLTLRQDGSNRQQGSEGDGEESPDVIRVMTVHASKGLEFPVVYLPNLLQQRFPLRAHAQPVPAPLGMLPAESEGKVAQESGEACLFYVGVTRARDHLILSYSERYGKQKAKPSQYLDPLIAGLSNERLTRVHWQESRMPEVEGDEPNGVSSQMSEGFVEAMKPKTLKASAIEMYQRCPRQYAYSTIYHFHGEEATYQLFWRATQHTYEALQRSFAETQSQAEDSGAHLPTQAEAQELYTQQWRELGGPTYPFAALYEQHGYEVIELLRRMMLENDDTQWELHQSLPVDIAGQTVHVPVDRVETSRQGNESPKFVRTQFGKRKDKPTAGMRELLYARAYRERHPDQSFELHYHNLSTGETFPISLSAKKEQSLYDELEQSLTGLESNEYPAKPDPFLCPTCPFFLICPA